jgi:2-(1,2-epoxy-1,2-dihydrophenyl)acetyl-CoA isomerase
MSLVADDIPAERPPAVPARPTDPDRPPVNISRDGAATTIQINRPERMNAWSDDVAEGLAAALREAAADDGVRAVVLTGTGRAFCSGADLKANADAAQAGALDTDAALRAYNPIITAIREMPKPVITAVNGAAAGAGVSLALAGDIVVAAESAYFLLAFTRIGLVPDAGASLFVPARVGFARAAEMAMLADKVPAAQAAEWGLINFAWRDDEFAAKTDELAQRLSRGPTRAYAGAKRELNTWMYGQLAQQLELEMDIQRELAKSPDFIEGVTAFNEKRSAKFTGK